MTDEGSTTFRKVPRPDVPLTRQERLVWAELCCRSGRQNAVQIARLRVVTGLSERDIKGAVEGLIMRHGIAVGSSRGSDHAPAGYYLIDTADELEDTCRPLENQALSMLSRVCVLRGRDRRRLREALGQICFDQ